MLLADFSDLKRKEIPQQDNYGRPPHSHVHGHAHPATLPSKIIMAVLLITFYYLIATL
jgi:hypothetical protein